MSSVVPSLPQINSLYQLVPQETERERVDKFEFAGVQIMTYMSWSYWGQIVAQCGATGEISESVTTGISQEIQGEVSGAIKASLAGVLASQLEAKLGISDTTTEQRQRQMTYSISALPCGIRREVYLQLIEERVLEFEKREPSHIRRAVDLIIPITYSEDKKDCPSQDCKEHRTDAAQPLVMRGDGFCARTSGFPGPGSTWSTTWFPHNFLRIGEAIPNELLVSAGLLTPWPTLVGKSREIVLEFDSIASRRALVSKSGAVIAEKLVESLSLRYETMAGAQGSELLSRSEG